MTKIFLRSLHIAGLSSLLCATAYAAEEAPTTAENISPFRISLSHLIEPDSWQEGGAYSALNILSGKHGSIEGLEIGGLYNEARHHVYGLQVAGLWNRTPGSVMGLQIAGLANTHAQKVEGTQIAGLCNLAQGKAYNQQIAGLLNRAGAMDGLQLAGGSNLTANTLRGAQISGAFNCAAQVNGVQLAGVNYAKDVKGVQVGVVNISGKQLTGGQLGLINLAPNGYHEIALSGNTIGLHPMGMLTYRTGGRYLYTILTAGLMPAMGVTPRFYVRGGGIGSFLSPKHDLINVEAVLLELRKQLWKDVPLNLHAQLRLLLHKRIGFFAGRIGPVCNFSWVKTQAATKDGKPVTTDKQKVDFRIRPGLCVSLGWRIQ